MQSLSLHFTFLGLEFVEISFHVDMKETFCVKLLSKKRHYADQSSVLKSNKREKVP